MHNKASDQELWTCGNISHLSPMSVLQLKKNVGLKIYWETP